jgi:hypothetical protein
MAFMLEMSHNEIDINGAENSSSTMVLLAMQHWRFLHAQEESLQKL